MDISILIVDDNEIDRYLLKRQLSEQVTPPSIFEAGNGAEALAFLGAYADNKQQFGERFPPNIILLDINMPVVNGWEFLEQYAPLRERAELSGSVVMMFSSSEHSSDLNRAADFDFVKGYIVKGTLAANELQAILDKALQP